MTMKVLLVMPRSNKEQFKYDPDDQEVRRNYMITTGLPYISAYLKHNGVKVHTLNLNHVPGKVRDIIFEKMVRDGYYDIVFTGGVSLFYRNIKDMVKYIREVSPSTRIVVGGGLVSGNPKLVLEMLGADIAVVYEGEFTALDIVRAFQYGWPPSIVQGIVYRSGKTIIENPMREPIKVLDALPFPDYDGFGMAEYLDHIRPSYIAWDSFEYPRPYPVIGARGCPANCTFCFHTTGKGYRLRSIDNIMEELRVVIPKYKINIVFFFDELFSYDKERAIEFCRKFKEYKDTIPWDIHVMLNLRADCCDDEILDAVKLAGCKVVGLGLESASPAILKSMRKHITPEQVKKALVGIKERNMVVQGSFIFGDPAETLETAKVTCDWVMQHRDIIRDGAYLTFIMVFPGTALYKQAVERGIIKDERKFLEEDMVKQCDPHNPMNITGLSDDEFWQLKEMVWKTDFLMKYSVVPEEYDYHSKRIVVICPHCGERQWYNNKEFPATLGCRECGGRFYAHHWYFPLMQKVVEKVGFQTSRNLRNLVGVGK